MTKLELHIAWRYLRSRRGSRLLSLISIIAIGGVIVGVSALILIIGVMNGLQKDLREKILIGSPDVRVLTYGEDLSMSGYDGVVLGERLANRLKVVVADSITLLSAGAGKISPVTGMPAPSIRRLEVTGI